MAIDKITPNRLDRSSDFKLIPKTSMVDALNMIVTEDSANTSGDNVGDLGVLKNVKGNSAMTFASSADVIASGEAKIIGSVTDTKLKIVYFFVWHDDPNEHGVWAYDPRGKLPGGGAYTNAIRKIHKSSLYNFPQHGFVKGDLIYTSQTRLTDAQIKPGTEKDFEKDTILYFTDNKNEPKKINVSMALMNADAAYNNVDQIDFITACPRTPLTPITFNFNSDPQRTTSNFKSGPPFQFAYQYVYNDGVESAISTYSDVAIPPVIINQGSLTNINHNINNRCNLTIPIAGAEIQSVKILARRDNMPDMVILDQVDWDDNTKDYWNPVTGVYSFYNDRVVKGVSTNEVNKQFDNLPRIAQAQTVVDNRLMYGNYLEGFDNVKTQATGEPIFFERPLDFLNIDMLLVPAVSEQLQAASVNQVVDGFEGSEANAPFGEIYGGTINKSAGYILDPTPFPDIIDAGVNIEVTIKIAPESNFHVYQAQNSYHQSRHKGAWSQEDQNINYADPETYSGYKYGGFDNGEPTGAYGHQSPEASGEAWLNEWINASDAPTTENLTWGVPLAGNNRGVGATGIESNVYGTIPMPRWRTLLGTGNNNEVYHDVVYGTSAGNPLILQGGDIVFTVNLTTNVDFSGGARAAITSSIAQILNGESPTWGGGEAFIVNSALGPTYEHEIDLGIDSFDKFPDAHPYSRLVTSAMSADMLQGNPYANPVGHFIVDKAKVTFSIERDDYYSTLPAENGTYPFEMIRLVIDSIDPLDGEAEIDAITMVKKHHPNSPWIAIKKDFWLNFNFEDFESGIQTNLGAVSLGDGTEYYPAEENTIDDFSYLYPQGSTFSEPNTTTSFFNNELITYVSGRDNGTGSYNHNFYEENIIANLSARYFLGYLDFQQSESYPQFFRYYKSIYQNAIADVSSLIYTESFIFSLLDGEGGPGGALGHEVDGKSFFSSAPRRTVLEFDFSPGATSLDEPGSSTLLIRLGGPFYLGRIDCGLPWRTTTNPNFMDPADPYGANPFNNDPISGAVQNFTARRTFLPNAQGEPGDGTKQLGSSSELPGAAANLFHSSPYDGTEFTNIWENTNIIGGIDFTLKKSHIEIIDFLITNIYAAEDFVIDRTFKSNANHDFGIIYYDQRGRHGFVNHLTTVYVPGYSQAERGASLHGRTSILLNLEHEPPNWATHYKIAYTKNTTVRDFIQYSAGGAYIEDQDETSLTSSSKIYVSLNYLQQSGISYVNDWGARTPEGGLSFAKYLDGGNQKVRIISSYSDGTTRIFPNNFEFDVIDIVLLTDVGNPLASDTDIVERPELQGEFIVLKNNPSNNGFDYASIQNGDDLWGNRCIFELYTPERGREQDEMFYYEIGDTYEIVNGQHSVTSIQVDKGDVWWRKVPVNFSNFSQSQQLYVDLIQYETDNPNASSSNFLPYYLETQAASDLFKSDSSTIGRPNIIVEDAVESFREASITYSGQSNPNSRKVNYSSFNLTLSNYKDLQEEFGDINYMCNISGDVFVIQSDKCSLVPASKTLFSDVSGADTVVASRSPLGQESVISGRAGCDNNPESAVQVGSVVYFAHKTLGKIFRFAPQEGIQEISDLGMASYFRNLFKRALESSNDPNYQDIRVVGGYDPVNDEYLLTVLYELTIEESIPDVVVDDPYVGDVDDVDDSEGDVMVSDEICAEFVVTQTSVNNNLQPGDPVSIQFTITNVGQGMGALASNQFNSFPFEADESMATDSYGFLGALYGNFMQITEAGLFSDLYEDEELFVSEPAVTYEFGLTGIGGVGIGIFDQDPNLNPDLGMSIAALAGQYPTSVLAAPNHFPVLWPGASMTLTINGVVPPDATPQTQYNIQFNFMSFDMEMFEGAANLNPDLGIEGSTKFFALQDCYTQSEVMTINLNIIETETVDITTYNADLNNDGSVGSQDLLEFLTQFGDIGDNLTGDFDGDGTVSISDFLMFLSQYGQDAPNISDVIDVPTLNLDAFANAVINLSSQGQYGTTPIDLDSINTYADFLFAVPEGAINAILINQFSEVWSFIEGESDPINVLTQVYFVDENGDFIPYVSGETVSEAPPLNLCSYPSLQAPDGQINVSTALGAYAILGEQGFMEQFPIQVQQYITAIEQSTGAGLINIFITEYLANEDGSSVQIQCNVEGGYGGG